MASWERLSWVYRWRHAAVSWEMETDSRCWEEPGSIRFQGLQKGHSPDGVLILIWWDPCWTSNLKNKKSEITNWCCFKPISLWWFVTAATENQHRWRQSFVWSKRKCGVAMVCYRGDSRWEKLRGKNQEFCSEYVPFLENNLSCVYQEACACNFITP